MKEINRHLAEIEEKLLRLEVCLNQTNERHDALLVVLSWLLANHPGDEAMKFLCLQANELEGDRKLQEHVAVLDDLREAVCAWHALWPSAPQNRG